MPPQYGEAKDGIPWHVPIVLETKEIIMKIYIDAPFTGDDVGFILVSKGRGWEADVDSDTVKRWRAVFEAYETVQKELAVLVDTEKVKYSYKFGKLIRKPKR
jgi:hypothetical protein